MAIINSLNAQILEEVVVTATKRATVLQETSESVQAISADSLELIGLDTTSINQVACLYLVVELKIFSC